MQLQKHFLLIILCIFSSSMGMKQRNNTTMGMEITPQTTWHSFSDENLLSIAAHAHTKDKTTLTLVNKKLAKLITKENMLRSHPHGLSRYDCFSSMIKFTKTENENALQSLIQATPSHANDYAETFAAFLPLCSPAHDIITLYQKNPTDTVCIQMLLPTIKKICEGDETTINDYRSNLSPDCCDNAYPSALQLATENNHFAIAELLLLQNPMLLNMRIHWTGRVPLEIAMQQKNIPFCMFLLSYKKIDMEECRFFYGPFASILHYVASEIGDLELFKLTNKRAKEQFDRPRYCKYFDKKLLALAKEKSKEIETYILISADTPLVKK